MNKNQIENSLSRLESRLRGMIEGETARSPIPQEIHHQLVRILIQGMHAGVKKEPLGNEKLGLAGIAPDKYTLVAPLELAKALQANPAELERLTEQLTNATTNASFIFLAPPLIRVVGDPSAWETHIQMEFSHTRLGESYTAKLEEKPILQGGPSDGLMPRAFLIINGLSTYQIIHPITSIGSDKANQLVIKDPSVSKNHAQLRFIVNRFVLFDLDSNRGTYVNGNPITNLALNPGDVILLADVPLVFGQESSHQLGNTKELPANPPSIEILHG